MILRNQSRCNYLINVAGRYPDADPIVRLISTTDVIWLTLKLTGNGESYTDKKRHEATCLMSNGDTISSPAKICHKPHAIEPTSTVKVRMWIQMSRSGEAASLAFPVFELTCNTLYFLERVSIYT